MKNSSDWSGHSIRVLRGVFRLIAGYSFLRQRGFYHIYYTKRGHMVGVMLAKGTNCAAPMMGSVTPTLLYRSVHQETIFIASTILRKPFEQCPFPNAQALESSLSTLMMVPSPATLIFFFSRLALTGFLEWKRSSISSKLQPLVSTKKK